MALEQHQLEKLYSLMEILRNIDVGLVVIDRELKVHFWNDFMENHSGQTSTEVKHQPITALFDDIPEAWLRKKTESVFLLKNKAFMIWEQRPYLFRFDNYRPVTGGADFMYQNVTFIPLFDADNEVSHLCMIVYDVTDTAVHKQGLQKANQELAILSQTDGLTKLFNRAHWEECLEREYKRWQRVKQSSCLLMLDIDHFKSINDNYGHPVGDEVIRHLASLIRHNAREIDVSGRYGGEEFAIILGDTSLADAQRLAERLRVMVESSQVQSDGVKLKYTISLGLAALTDGMQSSQEWISCADKALYSSKEAGRNRVSLYSPQ